MNIIENNEEILNNDDLYLNSEPSDKAFKKYLFLKIYFEEDDIIYENMLIQNDLLEEDDDTDAEISKIPHRLFPKLEKLQKLNISSLNFCNFPYMEQIENLIYFNCQNNDIDHFDYLPPKLRFLNCAGNDLSSLPKLPNTLEYLICHANEIRKIEGGLLNTKLKVLFIGLNEIRVLPKVPTSICIIDCSYTKNLKINYSFESLVNLEIFICDGCDIFELPELPKNLRFLSVKENNLTILQRQKRKIIHIS